MLEQFEHTKTGVEVCSNQHILEILVEQEKA
jgi:hypothetical protein